MIPRFRPDRGGGVRRGKARARLVTLAKITFILESVCSFARARGRRGMAESRGGGELGSLGVAGIVRFKSHGVRFFLEGERIPNRHHRSHRRFRDVFYVEGNERGRGGKAQAANARTRPRRAAYAALDARPSSTAACARRRDAGRHAEP